MMSWRVKKTNFRYFNYKLLIGKKLAWECIMALIIKFD